MLQSTLEKKSLLCLAKQPHYLKSRQAWISASYLGVFILEWMRIQIPLCFHECVLKAKCQCWFLSYLLIHFQPCLWGEGWQTGALWQLWMHLETVCFLDPCQPGFHYGCGTETVLTVRVDYLHQGNLQGEMYPFDLIGSFSCLWYHWLRSVDNVTAETGRQWQSGTPEDRFISGSQISKCDNGWLLIITPSGCLLRAPQNVS